MLMGSAAYGKPPTQTCLKCKKSRQNLVPAAFILDRSGGRPQAAVMLVKIRCVPSAIPQILSRLPVFARHEARPDLRGLVTPSCLRKLPPDLRQAEAKQKGLGVWADPNPNPPWGWRRRKRR